MSPVDKALVSFAYELGQLKQTPRAGWHRAHVSDPESVAEHSWRVAVLAMVIAHEEGANAEHAAALGLLHDLPETRVGDANQVSKRYATTTDAVGTVEDQAVDLPPYLAQHIVALVTEHESAKNADTTMEAKCSRDADKVECLLQAREYMQAGNQVAWRWVEDMAAAVSTAAARELAETAQKLEPSVWWEHLSERHGLPNST